jgi:hypothetical protein
MTQRVGALLDEAVAGLEPKNPDPVPAVVARSRAARRRSLGAGILAVAVLIGGGVVVGTRAGGGGGDAPPAGPVPEAPTPRQVGDTVMAGDLTLPVPKGWRVVRAGQVPGDCAKGTMLEKTILISGPGEGGCVFAPIEVSGTRNVNPGGDAVSLPSKGQNMIVTSPRTYTLRGGEPAWLARGVDDEWNSPAKAPGFRYFNTLLLPWSRVSVTFRVPGPEQQRIIDSMRTAPPRRTTRLGLPTTVTEANLTVPDAAGKYAPTGYGTSKDPGTIAKVLEMLRAQKSSVDNAHSCASPGQRVARLTLNPARSSEQFIQGTTTTVLISLGSRCQEAVSSDGGRVRLSDKAMKDLKRLFGIAA